MQKEAEYLRTLIRNHIYSNCIYKNTSGLVQKD